MKRICFLIAIKICDKILFCLIFYSDIAVVVVVIMTQQKGWTVTVAGTYDDLAPDVQMHLSFPQRSSSQGKKCDKSTNIHRSIEQTKDTELELDTNSNYNDTDSQKPDAKPAILPPPTPQSIKLNPKRSLTKNYFNTGTILN